MLIVYRLADGAIESITGSRHPNPTEAEIVGIHLVEPLPDGQAEYRVIDPADIARVWEAYDKGAKLEVALDPNGQPIGIKADGVLIVPESGSA